MTLRYPASDRACDAHVHGPRRTARAETQHPPRLTAFGHAAARLVLGDALGHRFCTHGSWRERAAPRSDAQVRARRRASGFGCAALLHLARAEHSIAPGGAEALILEACLGTCASTA